MVLGSSLFVNSNLGRTSERILTRAKICDRHLTAFRSLPRRTNKNTRHLSFRLCSVSTPYLFRAQRYQRFSANSIILFEIFSILPSLHVTSFNVNHGELILKYLFVSGQHHSSWIFNIRTYIHIHTAIMHNQNVPVFWCVSCMGYKKTFTFTP